jgi:hypothetical protein
MAKTCKAEGCYNPVFGGGFCQRHGYLRDDKKPKKIAPRTQKEKVHEISFGFNDQISMFQALWENTMDKNGIVTCPYTKQRLNCFYNTDMWYSCFLHVLPKGRFPLFKLNPENIRVAYPLFHTLVDQGTSEQRAEHPDWDFARWYNEVEKMKAEYASFKKKNLLA